MNSYFLYIELMTATWGQLHSSKRIPRVNHSSGTSRAQMTLVIPEFTSKNAPSLSRVKVMEATDEFESSRTAYESVGQPMGAALRGWKIGNSNPVQVLARGPCCRLH